MIALHLVHLSGTRPGRMVVDLVCRREHQEDLAADCFGAILRDGGTEEAAEIRPGGERAGERLQTRKKIGPIMLRDGGATSECER